MTGPKTPFLLVVAFISGLAVMAMEISAARLLAPYFGTSLFVWTNIIGVVLVALSIGYYIGGKWADKNPDHTILLRLILAAGVFFLFVPWVAGPLASAIDFGMFVWESASIVIFTGSLLVTLILFAPPLFVLGMVSPFIIKLCSLSTDKIGGVAGAVFAVSTIGSILGTVLPTLWFIPTFGTKPTIIVFAVLLIAIAVIGLVPKKRFAGLCIILVLAFVLSMTSAGLLSEDAPQVLYEGESAYQYIRVIEDVRNRYLIFNEGRGIQTVYSKDGVLGSGMYHDYLNLLPGMLSTEDTKQVLIVGLAGGAISRQFDHFFRGEMEIDGVEIDRKVIDVANEYFDLQNPSLTVHNQDGRIFLANAEKKYDLIIVDAYTREMYIPWTLATKEFWQLVDNSLAEGGIVAANIVASSQESELFGTITNTMASVFAYGYATKSGDFNNQVVMSHRELPFTELPEHIDTPELSRLADHVAANTTSFRYDSSKDVFTDDWAPVEFLATLVWYKQRS